MQIYKSLFRREGNGRHEVYKNTRQKRRERERSQGGKKSKTREEREEER